MELNITALMNRREDMKYYSASQAELGSDAGKVTWENAKDAVEKQPLLTTEEEISEAKEWLEDFGAWYDDEIDAWDNQEVNALALQMIAGDIRERQHYEDRDELEEYEENQGGRINQGDDQEWYYYIGS